MFKRKQENVVWHIRVAQYGTKVETDLQRCGWEPFSSLLEQYDGKVWIVFRKQFYPKHAQNDSYDFKETETWPSSNGPSELIWPQ